MSISGNSPTTANVLTTTGMEGRVHKYVVIRENGRIYKYGRRV
jgi:hypothetical protein